MEHIISVWVKICKKMQFFGSILVYMEIIYYICNVQGNAHRRMIINYNTIHL